MRYCFLLPLALLALAGLLIVPPAGAQHCSSVVVRSSGHGHSHSSHVKVAKVHHDDAVIVKQVAILPYGFVQLAVQPTYSTVYVPPHGQALAYAQAFPQAGYAPAQPQPAAYPQAPTPVSQQQAPNCQVNAQLLQSVQAMAARVESLERSLRAQSAPAAAVPAVQGGFSQTFGLYSHTQGLSGFAAASAHAQPPAQPPAQGYAPAALPQPLPQPLPQAQGQAQGDALSALISARCAACHAQATAAQHGGSIVIDGTITQGMARRINKAIARGSMPPAGNRFGIPALTAQEKQFLLGHFPAQ